MTARRILLVVLLVLVMVPVSVVAIYFARGGGSGGPMITRAVSTPALSRWAEEIGDAASPREPHTSMRTLEAFIVDRVASHVSNIGDPSRVQIKGDGPAAPIANAVRERLASNPTPPGSEPAAISSQPGADVHDAAHAGDAPEQRMPNRAAAELRDTAAPPQPPLAVSAAAPEGTATVRVEDTAVEASGLSAPVPAPVPVRESDPTVITLKWRGLKQTPVAWSLIPARRGELIASVQGPRGNAIVTAELDEKPWLLIPPVMEGRSDYAVASLGTPMTTEEEARQSAQQITVDTLIGHLDARVRSIHRGALVSRDSLRRQAEWAVLGGGCVVDQCVVRVDRPYGAVWYAANLVDTSAARLDPLARVVARGAESQKRTIGASLIALPGMMLVLGVVYLALNALTRGYFRTHLRTIVVAVMAVAVVLVFLLVMG